jgi:hypothetical protein
MKAQQELVVAALQPVLVLPVEQKLLIRTTKKTVTRTMQLQPLKVLLLLLKLQQLLLLKVLHRPPKLRHRPKDLLQLLQLKVLHRPLKALLLLQKRSSWTVRCITMHLDNLLQATTKGVPQGTPFFIESTFCFVKM